MSKKSYKQLPLVKRSSQLNKRKEKESYAEIVKIGMNKPICEIVKKEKEIRTCFAITPWTAKNIWPMVHKGTLTSILSETPHSHNFYYSILL
jgi:hypothetical protein